MSDQKSATFGRFGPPNMFSARALQLRKLLEEWDVSIPVERPVQLDESHEFLSAKDELIQRGLLAKNPASLWQSETSEGRKREQVYMWVAAIQMGYRASQMYETLRFLHPDMDGVLKQADPSDLLNVLLISVSQYGAGKMSH